MPDIAQDNWAERDNRNDEIAPLGFADTLPASLGPIGRMVMGAIKRFWNRINPTYLTTGAADAYIVTTQSQPNFLNLYEIIRVRADRSNTTTTPTFQYAATTARVIVKASASGYVALVAGDIVIGQDHSFWYNGTNWVLSNPGTVDSSSTVGLLKTANNLSELTPTASTARGNIGAAPIDTPSFTGTVNVGSLTASSAVATDASKNLVSVTNTGTGNNVLATSPSLTTPNIGAATGTSLQLSGLTASSALAADASKNLVSVTNTGTGNNVLATSPTITTPTVNQANLVGVTDGSNAAAGSVGEFQTASVALGSAISLTSGNQTNIVSIALPAGDWDCDGNIKVNTAASTVTSTVLGALSTTSATIPTTPATGGFPVFQTGPTGGAGFAVAGATGRLRVSSNGSTTVYLVVQANFTTSTATAFGLLNCRRVR